MRARAQDLTLASSAAAGMLTVPSPADTKPGTRRYITNLHMLSYYGSWPSRISHRGPGSLIEVSLLTKARPAAGRSPHVGSSIGGDLRAASTACRPRSGVESAVEWLKCPSRERRRECHRCSSFNERVGSPHRTDLVMGRDGDILRTATVPYGPRGRRALCGQLELHLNTA